MSRRWVWTAPPGWPTPPAGWSPPPGWQPDDRWPPAPEGWQWWQQSPPSPLRFHALGALLLLVTLAGWAVAFAVLDFASAACAPEPGHPTLLHAGVALAGSAVLAVPLRWAWRARRLRYSWWPWAALAGLVLVAAVAAAVTARTPGCPFVF